MITLSRCQDIFGPPFKTWRFRALWWAVVAALLAGQALVLTIDVGLHFPNHSLDFAQHYFLARWVNQGGSVTDPEWPLKVGISWPGWMHTYIRYLPYQPLVLPVMRLLARLPYALALLLWYAGAAGLWWWLARAVARTLDLPVHCVRLSLVLFPPLWLAFFWGNLDIYLSALTALAGLLYMRSRWWASSFLWGCIGVLKPPFLLGAIPSWRVEPLKVSLGVLMGASTTLFLAWLHVGIEGLSFFIQHLEEYIRFTSYELAFMNASLTGWLTAWVGPSTVLRRGQEVIVLHSLLGVQWPVNRLVWIGRGLLLLLTLKIWWSQGGKQSHWLEQGLWLSLGILLSPFAWASYAVYLWPAILAFFRWIVPRRPALAQTWFLVFPGFLMALLWNGLLTLNLSVHLVPIVLGSFYLVIWTMLLLSFHRVDTPHQFQKTGCCE